MSKNSASQLESARLLADRYQLEQEIGRGGMGVIFRAIDTLMERPVAVKLLLATPGGGEHPATQRFLYEAKNAARIQHEHVIQVFDVGRSSAGEPFFVMELIDGLSLASLVKAEGRVPAARVVHIGVQVCDALHAAHKAGIVHRDLKLGNVLLIEREGQGDFVKLIDFGISRAADRARALTSAGETLGTIGYMAPEQILHEPVDARTDIYALGGVLYRLLTGQGLFRDSNAATMARDHLTTVPVAPHLRAPDAGIPEPLSAVVMRCLEKRPKDRFPSARHVAHALRVAIDPDAADEAPPSSRTLPQPYNATFYSITPGPASSSEALDAGPMSARSIDARGDAADETAAFGTSPSAPAEPDDPTLADDPVLDDRAAPPPDARVGEEATLDGPPPSESGARRTPELILAQRQQRAAQEASPPSRRAPPSTPSSGRAPLPVPSEPPPPSSRGARVAQPPPAPAQAAPRSLRPGRIGKEAPVPVRAEPVSARATAAGPRAREGSGRGELVEPPSGTRLSPTPARRSGPDFELADAPRSAHPMTSTMGGRRCVACNTLNERNAPICWSCKARFDPASQGDLKEKVAAIASSGPSPATRSSRPSATPLGAAGVLFRWAPTWVWTVLTLLATAALVVGEALFERHGPVFSGVIGLLIVIGVCGMVATRPVR
ncbi:MAG: protein kinase [Byssovorax sp.]